jgi:hypothetical protein
LGPTSSGTRTPTTLRGPAPNGHPCPDGALAASMPLDPLRVVCVWPAPRSRFVVPELSRTTAMRAGANAHRFPGSCVHLPRSYRDCVSLIFLPVHMLLLLLLLLIFIPRTFRHHKTRLGCRLNAGGVEWVERHGCRESRPRPWMADGGGPTERRRSEGTSTKSRPNREPQPLGFLGSSSNSPEAKRFCR